MYLLQSAKAHTIATVANFKLSDVGYAKPQATIILPAIWKNEPTIEPLLFPIRMRIITMIWKVWINLSKYTSFYISTDLKFSGSQKSGIPTWSTKYSHPEKLIMLTIFYILYKFYRKRVKDLDLL